MKDACRSFLCTKLQVSGSSKELLKQLECTINILVIVVQ